MKKNSAVCCGVQAARDGLLDVVKAHIDSCLSQINDVDDEGYTAMHYAARYNRVSVMEVLFAAGAGLSSPQQPVTKVSVFPMAETMSRPRPVNPVQ